LADQSETDVVDLCSAVWRL